MQDEAHDDDPPAAKKARAESSFFDTVYEPAVLINVDCVEAYMGNPDTSDDVLAFWKSKSAQWPSLATVAKSLLAIPATETSSERVFSLAGRTIEDRRSQLNVETVDDLLFVHGLNK